MSSALVGVILVANAVAVWLIIKALADSGLADMVTGLVQSDPTQLIGTDVTAARQILEEFGFRGPSWGMRSDDHPGVFITLRQDRSTLEVNFGMLPYGQPEEEDIEFVGRRAVLTFPTSRDEVEPALSRVAELRSVYVNAGRWRQAAEEHGLNFRVAYGLRRIEGDGFLALQEARHAVITAHVPPQVRAVPGSGNSGNPVLDMLIDSQHVPDELVESVLDLVHGRGATIRDGQLRLEWSGDMVEALGLVMPLAKVLAEIWSAQE